MNHQDHVHLLRRAVAGVGSPWADFGSGEGAFTLALRDLLGPDAEIYSIERDGARLHHQQRNFAVQFPVSNVRFLQEDFTRPLGLPPLNGMVIANALHFYRDKVKILRTLRDYLLNHGRLVVVEYNATQGNPWVPFPFSFDTLNTIAPQAGFTEPELMETVPSSFLRQIYSALAFKLP